MSATVIEYFALFAFLLLFSAVIVGEVLWLKKKGWANTGRSVAYVLTTDFVSFCVGSVIVMVIALLLLMMVLGPSGQGSNAGETSYVILLVLGAIIQPIVLILTKRLFLKVFQLQSGKSSWVYSFLVTLLIFFVVIIPPPLIFYLGIKLAG